MIVLICGKPGAGKSTLTGRIAPILNAPALNGDEIRATLSADLSFSAPDRVIHAWRIGSISRLLDAQGFTVIADFICPTELTREAFGRRDLLVWVNRPGHGRFSDTERLWENPADADVVIDETMSLDAAVDAVLTAISKLPGGEKRQ